MGGEIRRFDYTAIQAATTVLAAKTALGGVIDVRNYDTIIFWYDYTNGDETSYDLIPQFLGVAGGDEHPMMEWSAAAIATVSTKIFRLSASAKGYITLDIRGVAQMKIYGDATGGTPTGTVQIGYTLVN